MTGFNNVIKQKQNTHTTVFYFLYQGILNNVRVDEEPGVH